MPLLARWEYDGGLWGVWKMSESAGELEAMLDDRSLFGPELDGVRSPKRRMEILGVRVLLKTLSGKECRVVHAPSGKPCLEGEERQVTISHTGGYVAVGLHDRLVPGIDIEQVGDRVKKVASRFVRADELPGAENMTDREYLLQLLLHWSAKETLYKVLDQEGVDFLGHLRIRPFTLSGEGEFPGESLFPTAGGVFPVRYFVHPDFVCTYCCRERR